MNWTCQIRFVASLFIPVRNTVQYDKPMVLMIMNEHKVHLVFEELYPRSALCRTEQDNRFIL